MSAAVLTPLIVDGPSLADSFAQRGYAVLQTSEISPGRLLAISREIGLGMPVVPDYYRSEYFYSSASGFNVIESSTQSTMGHRAFGTCDAVPLHVDGVLFAIGDIATTMLACESEAGSGGHSLVFAATEAFQEFEARYPDLGASFRNPAAITRVDLGRTAANATGPAFSGAGTELKGRFCLDRTTSWNFECVERLREAYELFIPYAHIGSKYVRVVQLRPGEILILANDKVSHGRTPFVDTATKRRRYWRGLFRTRPVFC